MNHVLEQNLEALIGRAYHPVRPREEFRVALLAELHTRLEGPAPGDRFRQGPRASSPRSWRPSIAIAAALLIAVPLITMAALELLRSPGSHPTQGTLDLTPSNLVPPVGALALAGAACRIPASVRGSERAVDRQRDWPQPDVPGLSWLVRPDHLGAEWIRMEHHAADRRDRPGYVARRRSPQAEANRMTRLGVPSGALAVVLARRRRC